MGFGKGLGCSGTCAKMILFVVNFVVFACGAAILGIGIALLVSDEVASWLGDLVESEEALSDDLILAAVYMMIAVGALFFLVGFFGCCGACKESKCMLTTYVVLVSLLLIVQLAGAILAIVFRAEVDSGFEDAMTEAVQHRYGAPNENATTNAWDEMQHDWKCCGSYDHTSYNGSYYMQTTSNVVPVTCCKKTKSEDGDYVLIQNDYTECKNSASASDGVHYHTEGCYTTLKDWVEENTAIIIGVLIGLGVVQLVAACLACCLAGRIKDDFYVA